MADMSQLLRQAQLMQVQLQVEDLIAVAFNAAALKVADGTRSTMASVTAGRTLPPGLKLPV